MVEWKKLGEVCDIKGRIGFRGYTREDQVEKGQGAISLSPGNITGDNLNYDSCTYIKWEKYIESPEIMVNEGDIILCKTASVGKVARIKNLPEKATINPQLVVLKHFSINPQYIFYVLTDYPFQYRIKGLAGVGSVPNVSQAKLSQILIPIPSLSEQERIVGILDTFTASIDNLKEQISQRRKQFECYRDQLLDLEGKEGVEMKTLEDCAILISDGDHQPPPKTQQGIPFITISNINKDNHKIDFSNTYYVPKEYYESIKNERKAKEGDVLYTVTGSYGIPVNIDFAKEFCFQRHIAMIRPNIDVLLSKFLYHSLLTMGVKKQADENASGGAQKTVSLSSLRKFIIYVPPTSEQQRIVSILDTFEASISNLEAQLELRQKQYEYYRNKLLTFD